jgi:hypothetical protein
MTPTSVLMAVLVWLRASERISVTVLDLDITAQFDGCAIARTLSSLEERLDPAGKPIVHVVSGCCGSIRQAKELRRHRIVRHRLAGEKAGRTDAPCRGLIWIGRQGSVRAPAAMRQDATTQYADIPGIAARRIAGL